MRAGLVEVLRCPRSGAPLALDAHERAGEEVEAGVLRGPAGDYPILSGIAILLEDPGAEVLARTRAGDHAGATALAAVRGIPLSRLDSLVPALLDLRPSRPIGRWLASLRDRRAVDRARQAVADSGADPDPLLRFTHLEHRAANAEGYRYFRYRLGLPRHLVALGAAAAARPGGEPIVEVGCGAGHMTWQLQQLFSPRPFIGIDREFQLLWVARHHIAPDADLLCADATALPIADGSCSLGVAVDVLSFVANKAVAARELRRAVGGDHGRGGLLLTSLINRDAAHEFSGDPLPIGAWTGLAAGMPHVTLADGSVLDSYLDGRCAPTGGDGDATLEASRTVTVLAGAAAIAGLGDRLDGWPHAIGRLGPHPLLAPRPVEQPGVRCWRRSLPSPAFLRDNPDLDRYLAPELCLDLDVVDAAGAGERPAAIEAAVARVAVIGYPDRWPADPWAGGR